jgi:hypothetical protein
MAERIPGEHERFVPDKVGPVTLAEVRVVLYGFLSHLNTLSQQIYSTIEVVDDMLAASPRPEQDEE